MPIRREALAFVVYDGQVYRIRDGCSRARNDLCCAGTFYGLLPARVKTLDWATFAVKPPRRPGLVVEIPESQWKRHARFYDQLR